jgi:hypothetical protein
MLVLSAIPLHTFNDLPQWLQEIKMAGTWVDSSRRNLLPYPTVQKNNLLPHSTLKQSQPQQNKLTATFHAPAEQTYCHIPRSSRTNLLPHSMLQQNKFTATFHAPAEQTYCHIPRSRRTNLLPHSTLEQNKLTATFHTPPEQTYCHIPCSNNLKGCSPSLRGRNKS